RNILDAISRYSCKYAGICYLSKQKIAEDAGYKSRRTAIRACNRMEALGIIEQHETKRVKGDRRQSVNVIVIKEVVANCNEQTKVLHNPQDRTQETIVKKFDKQTSENQKSSFDKSRRTKTRTSSHSNHSTRSEERRVGNERRTRRGAYQ